MPIRDALAPDFPAIADITNHYILHTPIHFSYDPVTAEELRDTWQKGLPRHPFLVLEENSTILGYAKAGAWRTRTAYDRTAEVGIYLRHDLTGRGLGKPLYAALIAACRAAGMHSLIGGIALPNPGSIRLHESLGFAPAGVVRQAGWKFNAWHDVGFWQLML
jgi:L-amino acid N-acyltransferase YncA